MSLQSLQNNYQPTKQVNELHQALLKRGVETVCEYSDGHKHVDLAILQAGIYIEVDGSQHFTDAKQIKSDFKRGYWSTINAFDTIHIPNSIIEKYLDKVADAITEVVKERIK